MNGAVCVRYYICDCIGHIVLDGCAYQNWQVYRSFDLQSLNDLTSEFQLEGIKVEPRRYVLPIAQELQVWILC